MKKLWITSRDFSWTRIVFPTDVDVVVHREVVLGPDLASGRRSDLPVELLGRHLITRSDGGTRCLISARGSGWRMPGSRGGSPARPSSILGVVLPWV